MRGCGRGGAGDGEWERGEWERGSVRGGLLFVLAEMECQSSTYGVKRRDCMAVSPSQAQAGVADAPTNGGSDEIHWK